MPSTMKVLILSFLAISGFFSSCSAQVLYSSGGYDDFGGGSTVILGGSRLGTFGLPSYGGLGGIGGLSYLPNYGGTGLGTGLGDVSFVQPYGGIGIGSFGGLSSAPVMTGTFTLPGLEGILSGLRGYTGGITYAPSSFASPAFTGAVPGSFYAEY